MRQVKMTRDSFHVFQANARNALKQSEQVPSILICAGTHCIAGGAMKIYDNLKTECEKRGLPVYVGLKHDTDAEKSLHVKMSRLPRLLRRWGLWSTSSLWASCTSM